MRRVENLSLASLCAVLVAACGGAARAAPVRAAPAPRHVAPAPTAAAVVPRDEVLLVGTPRDDWELVNHTPVAVEPVGHFVVEFERLGFDGRWLPPMRISYCLTGYGFNFEPVAPGERRRVGRPYPLSDDRLTAGTWRAVVAYRDPRHPAFPARTSVVFDVVGLDDAQAEEVLSLLASPEGRACAPITGDIAHAFARTAPQTHLTRLLELPDLSVAEREAALVAVTAATGDATVLRRAIADVRSPPAALAVARAITQSEARDEWMLEVAASTILPRVLDEGPIEVADVDALLTLRAHWGPEVFPRVLGRIARDRDRGVRLALAEMVAALASGLANAELTRAAQVLRRAASQTQDADLRQFFLDRASVCTEALREGVWGRGYGGYETQSAEGTMTPERCWRVVERLATMARLANGIDAMRFVPRGDAPTAR